LTNINYDVKSGEKFTSTRRKARFAMGKKRLQRGDVLIGRRIRKRRKELGLSQSDLAHPLHVQYQHVGRMEKGKARVMPAQLQIIAHVLRVSTSYFSMDSAAVRSTAKALRAQPEVDAFAATEECRRLAKAFQKIKDRTVRGQLSKLVGALANAK